jgi:hypothetical protein
MLKENIGNCMEEILCVRVFLCVNDNVEVDIENIP